MDNEVKTPFLKKFLYVLYGIFCVVVFSYMLFPYYVLKPRFENALSRATNMDVSITSIKPVLPIGWTFMGLSVSGGHVMDSLTLKPHILPLFIGRFSLGVRISEGNGILKGNVGTNFLRIGNRMEINLHMKKFEFSVFKHLSRKLDELSGTVNGDINVVYMKKQPDRSTGGIDLTVENGQIPLNIPGFPVAAIPFTMFALKADMDNGLLRFSRAELSGNEVSGNMRGDVRIGGSLDASDLNLLIGLRLSPSYMALMGPSGNENIRVTVRGTLGSPRTTVQ